MPLSHPVVCSALALACLAGSAIAQPSDATRGADDKRNWFDDPFFRVGNGMPRCPIPEGPFYTEGERRQQMHSRLERGTSCWLAGRCKSSNAYLDDKPLAIRVRAALRRVPGVGRSSVWVTVQRRWVYLQGCVPNRALASRLVHAARAVRVAGRGDEGNAGVETVVPDLMVGTAGPAPYPVKTRTP